MKENDAMVKKIFIERVNGLMYDNDMAQKDIESKTDIAQSRLSKLLNKDDSATPKVSELIDIAKCFNVTIDYLVTDKKTESAEKTTPANWTYREFIDFLITMQTENNLKLEIIKENDFPIFDGEFLESVSIYFNDLEICCKLLEWIKLSSSLVDNKSDYAKDALRTLKNGFLLSVSDNVLFCDLPF